MLIGDGLYRSEPHVSVESSLPIAEFRELVAVFATVGIAWLILMVEAVFGGRELLLSGVSIPPILYLVGSLLVVGIASFRRFLAPTAFLLAPFCLVGIMLFTSTRPDYGSFKFFNLLAITVVVVPLISNAVQRVGVEAVAKNIVIILGALLAGAVIYKLRYGFFDRQVLFLMNGPIVFGRLMGIAAVLSLLALRGMARYVAFAVFSLAVLWTMSKGPLLALMVTTILSALWLLKGSDRWMFVSSVLLAIALVAGFAWETVSSFDWGRLTVLWGLFSKGFQHASADPESLGARYVIYLTSFEYILAEPLGAGLGSWSTTVPESFGLDYPHNLLLELWSECGIVLGTVGLIPFLLFLAPGHPALRGVGLFLFMAQMVSGDLLDARFLLCFSLVSYIHFEQEQGSRAIELPSPSPL